MVFIIDLLMGSDRAWHLASEIWIWYTLVAVTVFALMVTYCKVTLCMELVALHYSAEGESVLGVMKTCVYLSKLWCYSGTQTD